MQRQLDVSCVPLAWHQRALGGHSRCTPAQAVRRMHAGGSPPPRQVRLCTLGASGLRGGSAISGVNSAQNWVVSFCHQLPQLAGPSVKSGGRAREVMNSMAGQRTAEGGTSSCTPWKAGRDNGLLLQGGQGGAGQSGEGWAARWYCGQASMNVKRGLAQAMSPAGFVVQCGHCKPSAAGHTSNG